MASRHVQLKTQDATARIVNEVQFPQRVDVNRAQAAYRGRPAQLRGVILKIGRG